MVNVGSYALKVVSNNFRISAISSSYFSISRIVVAQDVVETVLDVVAEVVEDKETVEEVVEDTTVVEEDVEAEAVQVIDEEAATSVKGVVTGTSVV